MTWFGCFTGCDITCMNGILTPRKLIEREGFRMDLADLLFTNDFLV